MKPTADSLKEQRSGLRVTGNQNSSDSDTSYSYLKNFIKWEQAVNRLKTKQTEYVKEARDILSGLVMDDSVDQRAVFYDLACCESILGNVQAGITWLSKSVAAGLSDTVLIESNADFDGLRKSEAYYALIASLKASQSAPALSSPSSPSIPSAFLQYYLSTLRCVDMATTDEKDRYKWPVREAAKAEGKRAFVNE